LAVSGREGGARAVGACRGADALDLVARGDTVVVVEHNLDVIRNADWVVDLGPDGGEGGGRLVAEGPPERIAATEGSWTGAALRADVLEPA
jgi:excinuclease ABC subunit A